MRKIILRRKQRRLKETKVAIRASHIVVDRMDLYVSLRPHVMFCRNRIQEVRLFLAMRFEHLFWTMFIVDVDSNGHSTEPSFFIYLFLDETRQSLSHAPEIGRIIKYMQRQLAVIDQSEA